MAVAGIAHGTVQGSAALRVALRFLASFAALYYLEESRPALLSLLRDVLSRRCPVDLLELLDAPV